MYKQGKRKGGEEVTIPTDLQENSPYYIIWLNFSAKQTGNVIVPKSKYLS